MNTDKITLPQGDSHAAALLPIMLEGGELMLNASGFGEHGKKGSFNYVTDVDLAVQNLLFRRIAEIFPEAQFIGEESDNNNIDLNGLVFIIDPIDGTSNFINGLGMSVISVATAENGEVVHGAVYDPYRGEFFTASKGGGAFLNGSPIRVSDKGMDDGLIGFGTSPYKRKEFGDKTFEMVRSCFEVCRDLRRCGSAAQDLCHVACGRLEGFFELTLCPWDFAAGDIIVREAGGKAGQLENEPLSFLRSSSVAAGSPQAYDDIVKLYSSL